MLESVETSNSEQDLIRRVIAGDREAFGEIYANNLDAIFRFIYFRIGDLRDAEDITEQVFFRAWQAFPAYQQNGAALSCWLYRIAHNLIIDYHRHNQKDASFSLDERERSAPLEVNLLADVIHSEEITALTRAIAKLNEDQQQVIILRFVEGLSHPEIAHILEKSEGACRMLQTRALIALQRLLSDTQGSLK